MNFVAGICLKVFRFNEEHSFWSLLQLFKKQGFINIFDTSTKRYKILTYQLEKLLQLHLPYVSLRLTEFGLDLEIYTVRWIFSMFSTDLPFSYAVTLLDIIMLEPKTAILKVSLAIFFFLEKDVLDTRDTCELNEVLKGFRKDKRF